MNHMIITLIVISSVTTSLFANNTYDGPGYDWNTRVGTTFDPFRPAFRSLRFIQPNETHLSVSTGSSYETKVAFVSDWKSFSRATGFSINTGFRFLGTGVKAAMQSYNKQKSENQSLIFDLYVARSRKEELQGNILELAPPNFEKGIDLISKNPDRFMQIYGREFIRERTAQVGLTYRLQFNFDSSDQKNEVEASLAGKTSTGSVDLKSFSKIYDHSNHFKLEIAQYSWGIKPTSELGELVTTLTNSPRELGKITNLMNECAETPDWDEARATSITTSPITEFIPVDLLPPPEYEAREKLRMYHARELDRRISELLEEDASLMFIAHLVREPYMQKYLVMNAIELLSDDLAKLNSDVSRFLNELETLGPKPQEKLEPRKNNEDDIVMAENILRVKPNFNRYFDQEAINHAIQYSGWRKSQFVTLFPAGIPKNHTNLRLIHGPDLIIPEELFPFIREVAIEGSFARAPKMNSEHLRAIPSLIRSRNFASLPIVSRYVQIDTYNIPTGYNQDGKGAEDYVRAHILIEYSNETAKAKPKLRIKFIAGLEDLLFEFKKNGSW